MGIFGQKGKKFLDENPDAVKMYAEKKPIAYMEFVLHRSYKRLYARFKDDKGRGVAFLPNKKYNFQVRINSYPTITTISYSDFVPASGKQYLVKYDSITKVCTIEEKSAG